MTSLNNKAFKKKPDIEIATSLSSVPFMFPNQPLSYTQASTSSSDRKLSESSLNSQSLKFAFKQEMQKIGISAALIPEKNPLKDFNLKVNSPSSGLPFQRRCRSNSPPKEDLKLTARDQKVFFPPSSPVMVSHKLKLREDFTGLGKESESVDVEDDEDLKKLKEEYRKMLEVANYEKDFETSSDEIEDEGAIEEIETQIGVNRRRYFK